MGVYQGKDRKDGTVWLIKDQADGVSLTFPDATDGKAKAALTRFARRFYYDNAE